MTKKATTWRTRTRMPVAISDHGATIASRTGRTRALKSPIRMTASAAAPMFAISIPADEPRGDRE